MKLQNLIPNWILQFVEKPSRIYAELTAGLMMAVLVIPQSLGYATLAGLPPIMGLYASITPVLVYAWLGASSIASVGPVAVTAIMTASALSHYALGSPQYIQLAITLAFMVGVILSLASMLRLGWIMQFVSRGVAAGFVSGAAILIILSQIKYILGISLNSDSLILASQGLYAQAKFIHLPTAMLGMVTLIILLISRYGESIVWGSWLPKKSAGFAGRLFVIILVMFSIWLAHHWQFDDMGIRLLQALPTGFPSASLPTISVDIIVQLLPSALLIALVAFISSSTIAGQHARLRGEDYQPNKDLLGLGLANLTSGLYGGFAVSGGISRTSLNLSVGSNSPLSSIVCAIGIWAILMFFGRQLEGLPYAVLAAVIITSVVSMVDKKTFKQAWQHDRADAICFIITFITAITFGLNAGLVSGILTSFAMMVYRTHQVHIATVGRIDDSEHYRNVKRHSVTTFDGIMLLRIDESLYFGNCQTVHGQLSAHAQDAQIRHLVLIMTAVNHIDLSAQEMLLELNKECLKYQKQLHFAEIKGPVMDKLVGGQLLAQLSGQVFLSTNQAVCKLTNPDADCDE